MGDTWTLFRVLGRLGFILKDMLERIDATLTDPEDRDAFRISQVKQKFGELRCYHTGDERIERIVQAAEAGIARHMRGLCRTVSLSGQGMDFGPVSGPHGLEGAKHHAHVDSLRPAPGASAGNPAADPRCRRLCLAGDITAPLEALFAWAVDRISRAHARRPGPRQSRVLRRQRLRRHLPRAESVLDAIPACTCS